MISYRVADLSDLNSLVLLRLEFLDSISTDNYYDELKVNIEKYFNNKITSGECTIILAEDNGNVIGTGIIFYYESVPSVSNIYGKNGYITSMYVNKEYRRNKIGSNIITRLIKLGEENNCGAIMLNATEVGKKLYEKHGFTDIHGGMIYKVL